MSGRSRHAPFRGFLKSIERATPLEIMEAEARKIWPAGAERGSLYVLKRGEGFSYQFGDVEISRREAALRAEGRAL